MLNVIVTKQRSTLRILNSILEFMLYTVLRNFVGVEINFTECVTLSNLTAFTMFSISSLLSLGRVFP